MNFYKYILLTFFLSAVLSGSAQTYDGNKGFSVYKKYDKSYVTPDLRGKNGVSIGGVLGLQSPFGEDPFFGVHLGYNYLIIKERRRITGQKEKTRDEVKSGFGVHFNYFYNNAFYGSIVYYNPVFSLKGKFISLYFLNEFGLGIHVLSPNSNDFSQKTRINLSIEPLRFRFGKSPLVAHLTTGYGLNSNILGKDVIDFSWYFGLRYYIFKKA